MAIDIKAPIFPESVADGTVATWHKKVGDKVVRDEVIVDIETDKVVLEVVAPADGFVSQIIKAEGDTVLSQETLAIFETGTASLAATTASASAAPVAAVVSSSPAATTNTDLAPSVRKAVAENQLDPSQIAGSGRGGRITKEDVTTHLSTPAPVAAAKAAEPVALSLAVGERIEKRVPMTRLRAKVAERLLQASQGTAMLTTFNEVNMKPIMEMRKAYGERFEKRHGVRLGFMSFFVKAAVEALKRFPAVNASLDGNDIVYHGYHDVGVAVSSDRGLVVPIVRDAERMNLAEIEKNILEYGKKAKEGKLSLDDITGGTFTISNGGVFGSLLSTPLLNPPQTAILGMHKIQERPMAVKGEVVILPMMYLALSYDHRLIDGKEAVSFLVTIKDLVEDPALLLLDL